MSAVPLPLPASREAIERGTLARELEKSVKTPRFVAARA